MFSSKVFVTLITLIALISAQNCPQLCTSNCTGGTCSTCRNNFSLDATVSSNCSCPTSMFLNSTNAICQPCPITCLTCSYYSKCSTCIPGFMLSNDFGCIPGIPSATNWVSKNISYEFTNSSSWGSNVLITAGNATFTSNATNLSSFSCSKMPQYTWLGGSNYPFDYTTNIIKSAFNLPPHQWINIRFQAVLIDNWLGNTLLLEMNTFQSYLQTSMESPQVIWQGSYVTYQRFADFCGNASFPDNLAVADAWSIHNVSSVKLRIRMNESETPYNASSNLNQAFFAIRQIYIRVGTCGKNCLQCSGPYQCTRCVLPYSAANGSCVCNQTLGFATSTGCQANCLPGYYLDATKKNCLSCQNIISNCQTCNSTKCTTCSLGYFYFSNSISTKCVRYCPSGFTQTRFYNATLADNTTINRDQCTPCPSNCSMCNANICLFCLQGFIYYQGNCIFSCPSATYGNQGTCSQCPSNCLSCTDSSTCTTCAGGFKVSNSQGCIPYCLNTTILSNSTTKNCNVTCYSGCSNCYGPDSNQCLSCSTGFLQNGQCTSCSTVTAAGLCLICPDQCSTCVSSTNCTTCNAGSFNYNGTCARFCPTSYYPTIQQSNTTTSYICLACQTGCQRCKSSITCMECQQDYINFNFTCVKRNPSAFYFDDQNQKFKSCQGNCLKCHKLVCFRCAQGFYLNQGVCVTDCGPDKYQFLGAIHDDNSTLYGFCKWRSPQCELYDATRQDGTCNQCSFFQPSLYNIRIAANPICGYSCPEFYGLASNSSCYACPQNCRRCNSNFICLECLYNYVINSPDQITTSNYMNQSCIPNYCPPPYFSDSVQCQMCSPGCSVCQIDGRCIYCSDSYSLSYDHGVCYQVNCSVSQYYVNNSNSANICQSCVDPCATCLTLTVCSSCISLNGTQLNLLNGSCLAACPIGYFAHQASSTCRKCNPKCATCSSFYSCLTCSNQYYLLSFYDHSHAQCVTECPIGFWSDTAVCQSCYRDCQSCYGPSEYQCLTCYPNFFLDDYKCTYSCSLGKYEDDEGYCDWCDPSCLECNGPTPQNCMSCASNYYLSDNQCHKDECPDATYLSIPEKRVCERCQFGCSKCISPQFCKYCFTGYSLYKGWCYLQCPGNLVSAPFTFRYGQGAICSSCLGKYSSRCQSCDSISCNRCANGYYLYRNNDQQDSHDRKEQCVTTCPIRTYVKSQESKECVSCQNHCNNCTSSQNCVSCNLGWNLINGYCSAGCPSGTYLTIYLNCSTCITPCLSCSSSTNCTLCQSGYYLFTNSTSANRICTSTCPNGYFADGSSGWCRNCLSSCYACTAINTCTQCYSNYTLTNGMCQSQTISNCSANCQTCTPQTCLKCFLPYLLYTNSATSSSSCVSICPSGYYSSIYTCEKCNSSCISCANSASNCSQCQNGLYFLGQSCVLVCPVGYYASTALQLCQACPSNCLNCQISVCFACQNGFYLYSGQCYSNCPAGTYISLSTNQCFTCESSCTVCSSSSNCTSCSVGYSLINDNCLFDCPSSTYAATVNNASVCLPCVSPCYFCSDQQTCITCLPNYILNGTICQANCNTGYYQSISEILYFNEISSYNYMQCLPCDLTCLTCTTSSTICLSCNSPYVLYGSQCLIACPSGTYINQGICTVCSAYCIACSDSVTCTICANNTALYQNQCVSTCPLGFYMKSQVSSTQNQFTCQACSTACQSCTGPSQYECLTCSTNFYSNGVGICVSTCPKGTYANTLLQICSPCPYSCSSCVSSNNCTTCNNNYTITSTNQCNSNSSYCTAANCKYCLTSNQTQCAQCLPNYYLVGTACTSQCPSGTYQQDGKCISCSNNCTSCSPQGCLICSSGFYLYQGKCLTACPANTFASGSNCQTDPCLAYDSTSGSCLLCICPYLLYNMSSYNSSANITTYTSICSLKCPSNTIQSGSSCVPCPNNCLSCISTSICTSCSNGTYLSNGHCLNSCPLGMYPVNSICQNCTLPYCSQCAFTSGTQVCIDCDDTAGFFLFNGTCMLICPTGTYGEVSTSTCNNCQQGCSQCTGLTTCTSCSSGYYLYLGQCLSSCPAGTYQNGNICSPCSNGCYKCSSGTNCTMCQSSYSLFISNSSSSCVTTCQTGYYSQTVISISYSNSNQLQCSPCVSPCLTCTSSTSCTQCITGTSLFGTICVSSCPQGYYLSNYQTITINSTSYSISICYPCSSACLTCSNTSSSCVTCPSGYWLDSNNNCVSNCSSPTQYYSQTTRQCSNCSQLCYSCYGPGTDNCLSCRQPLQLYAGSCFSTCPFGYYSTSAYACKACSSPCVSCQVSSTNCTVCSSGSYLLVVNNTGSCVSSCSTGYYLNSSSQICLICDSSCLTCIGGGNNQCTACSSGLFLVNQMCISTCPSGTTGIISSGQYKCSYCPTNCVNCLYSPITESVACTQCATNYYLVNGNCSQTCPQGTYSSQVTFTCITCGITGCQTCGLNSSLIVSCSACQAGYYLLNGICFTTCPSNTSPSGTQCLPQQNCQGYQFLGFCFNTCPTGTYATNLTITVNNTITVTLGCNNCSTYCESCVSSTTCSKCASNTYLYTSTSNGTIQSTCVSNCPSNYYAANNACLQCLSPCLTCQATATSIGCLSCQSGYYLLGSSCYIVCPLGYFQNGNVCSQCSSLCSTCSGTSTNCTLCKNIFSTIPSCGSSSNNTLVCNSTQYQSSNSTCSNCNSACATCYGGSSYECSSCLNASNILVNGVCVANCPSGTVKNSTTCTSCPSNCLTCTITNNTLACTSCAATYILTTATGANNCVLSCSSLNTAYQSYILLNGQCQACSIIGCLACSYSNSQFQCSSCVNSTFLYNQQCITACPSATMPSYNPNTCIACSQNCTSCNSTACTKCSTGYNLLNGNCVSNCGSGYYALNSTCFKCSITNCVNCTSTSCQSCQQPYLIVNGQCTNCISGYYSTSGVCQICSSQCSTCSVSSTNCTSCANGFLIFNSSSCVSACPTGYYSSSGICTICSANNCQTCTATGCTSCLSGYFAVYQSNQLTCQSSCPASTYPSSSSCIACSTSCITCTSSMSCSSCAVPSVLSQGYCITSCPSGSVSINQTCVNCPTGCKTCSSLSSCTSCTTGLSINSNGSCSVPPSNCTGGYYLNALNTCSQCYPTCNTCLAGSSSDCLSCFSGYNLTNGVCVQYCSSNQFYNSNSSSCQLCSSILTNCVSCTSTSCLICATNYTVSNGRCTQSCPSGTFLSNSICVTCSNYCLSCSSSSICNQCLNSSFIMLNGLCFSSCPDQYYFSNSTCKACYQTCLTCSGSSTNCSSCITPYNLYASSCTASCPNSTYPSNYICVNCSVNCQLCTDLNACTQCSSSYYLINGTCRTTCPSGYYIDSSSNRCLQCVSPCLVCTSRTGCSSCQSPATLSNGICVNSNCTTGYYNYTLNICANCTVNHCAYCTNSSCSYCLSGYYSIYQGGVLTYCQPACLSGTYPDNATMNCSSCFTNCFSCTNATWCSFCSSGYYLLSVQGAQANECVTTCPLGYFQNSSILACSPCSSNCQECINSFNCTVCYSNYYQFISNGSISCVSNCPTSYYTPTSIDGTGTCGPCASNCYNCSDANTCTQCISSIYVIINGICTPSNCINCLTCNAIDNKCNLCTLGYYLFKDACLASCPDSYYPDNSTDSCLACTTNCLLCQNNYTCMLCISGYMFVNGTGCENAGLALFGVLGNMSGFTSNITKIMSIVYVTTSSGPIAFGAIGSTYGPMQFCQFMYLLQGSSGGNDEMSNFLNSLSSVSYTSSQGTNDHNTSATASSARLLTSIDYTSSFLATNYPIFLIMLAFIGSYFLVLLLEKYSASCCISCPNLYDYVNYTCDFMKRRFKYIYVDCVMWISYLPFLYFSILQLQSGRWDSGMNIFSSLLAIAIIITYPLYPIFILRKLFDRSSNPAEDLYNYKAITLKQIPRDEQKQMCADFQCCDKGNTETNMIEMSLSPYIDKVVRPIYNESDPDFSEFRYFKMAHWRLAYSAIKYFRKFLYVLIVALCPNAIATLTVLICLTALYMAYLIVLKPKEKLYLVLQIILESVLLFFVSFMLIYVCLGGSNVSYLSIVTHGIGFILANSTLAIAIILNLMAYYTIFCCIYDLIKHIRNKKIEQDQKYKLQDKQINGIPEKEKEKQEIEIRQSLRKGDDQMTVENNEEQQYIPYDFDDKELNGKSSMIKKKTFQDELPEEEDFTNLKSTKNPKIRHHRRAERRKSHHLDDEESHTSEEIMGQSKLSNEENEIADGLIKDKNSKFKREVNKNDVNVDKGEIRQPTDNFRRKPYKKESGPLEQESLDMLVRPEPNKKKSHYNKPIDEFVMDIDTHDRMVPPSHAYDIDPKFVERQAKRKDRKGEDDPDLLDEPYMRERQAKSRNSKPNDLNEGNMYERQGKSKDGKYENEKDIESGQMYNRNNNPKGLPSSKQKNLDEGNMYQRQPKSRDNRSQKEKGLDAGNMYERQPKSKDSRSQREKELEAGNMYDRQAKKRELKSDKEKELESGNMYDREKNKKGGNMYDFYDGNTYEEPTAKERSKNDNPNDVNTYDRQGKPKNLKDNKQKDLQSGNMVDREKERKKYENPFGEFDQIFEIEKPTAVKDADMKERQRQNKQKEKSLKEEKLISGFLIEPDTFQRKPQAKIHENLHYKGSSDDEVAIKQGQVVQVKNKFKRNVRQPERNVPEPDINAYGKDIKTKKIEKIQSTKEFAQDSPEQLKFKERQGREINKLKSLNEQAEPENIEQATGYTREKKAIERKKKDNEPKVQDYNLISANPKLQEKQKPGKKNNIYDDLDDDLTESIEIKDERVISKPKKPYEDANFEESNMEKIVRNKPSKSIKKDDNRLQVSDNLEESYDDVVNRNKQQIFKKQGMKSKNLLQIEEDNQFEEVNFQRPVSKIERPSSRSKDQGLGVNSKNVSEASDNESHEIRKRKNSAIQRQRQRGQLVVNEKDEEEDNKVGGDSRRLSRIERQKSKIKGGVLNIDDKSDHEDLEHVQL